MTNIIKVNKSKIICISGLVQDSEEIKITLEDGTVITQYHEQDCCESVSVEQVDTNNLDRFIGATVVELKEKILSIDELKEDEKPEYIDDSFTATFYTLITSKGYIDWRWYGTSNGYYSEDVTTIISNSNET